MASAVRLLFVEDGATAAAAAAIVKKLPVNSSSGSTIYVDVLDRSSSFPYRSGPDRRTGASSAREGRKL